MSKEYALEGVLGFRHWSDSYGRLGDARRAAKELCRDATGRTVMIMQKTPRPVHHEFGARWRPVAIVRQSDPPSAYREFARICKKDEAHALEEAL